MYLDVVVAVRLAAGRELIVAMVRQITRLTMHLSGAWVRQPVSRWRRWRERRSAMQSKKRYLPGRSDDDLDRAWGMLATA
jgi:hypothetical protein